MVTIEELVERFATGVANQTDAIWRGDSKTGNKFAKQYMTAFEKLRAFGDAGRDALATLFTHPRPDVRMAAASYLLRYRTIEATAILQELSQGDGLISFEAAQVLNYWKEGTWSLDPPDT
jgi:hypothetical protein